MCNTLSITEATYVRGFTLRYEKTKQRRLEAKNSWHKKQNVISKKPIYNGRFYLFLKNIPILKMFKERLLYLLYLLLVTL